MNRPTRSLLAGFILSLPLSAGALAQTAAPGPQLQRFTPADGDWSLSLPQDWRVDPNYVFNGLGPGRPLHGVLFQIPQSEAAGTNLSPVGTGVAILTVPAEQGCAAGDFLATARVPVTLTEHGQRWSMASSSEGGAGNLARTDIFARRDGNACLLVLYLTHWGQYGNYQPGSVRRFDRVALWRQFDRLRRQLRIRGQAPEPTLTISFSTTPQEAPQPVQAAPANPPAGQQQPAPPLQQQHPQQHAANPPIAGSLPQR